MNPIPVALGDFKEVELLVDAGIVHQNVDTTKGLDSWLRRLRGGLPTGAASYALPPADALLRRLRALLLAYAAAGGRDAVVLLHDGEHGAALIDALARLGDGLPANALPLAVNEVMQVGPETVAAAFAWGASGVRLLTRARPRHDMAGLARVIETSGRILAALGFGDGAVAAIETDDPDALGAALRGLRTGNGRARGPPTSCRPAPSAACWSLAMRELHRAAPAPVDFVALPAHAPFGGIEVRVDGCTLCLACVAACPTAALCDDPDQPMLSFDESLCVQCGLCASTCPEDAIALVPRLDFGAWAAGRRVVKEEEPFCVPAVRQGVRHEGRGRAGHGQAVRPALDVLRRGRCGGSTS